MEKHRLRFFSLSIALFTIASASISIAQNRHFILPNTHITQMASQETGRVYEIVVFLPADYESSPGKHYPVLYYTDAYWDTPLLHSMHGQLVYDKVIPELIMVGFSYPGKNPDYGKLRQFDLTPTRLTDDPNSGGAPEFLQFIEKQVIPYVESEYRAQEGERAISGNSLGDLFALYAMYQKPALFKRIISISPAIVWNNSAFFSEDSLYAAQHDSLPGRLFLSHGGDEYLPFRIPIIRFQELLENRAYEGLAMQNYTIGGERHSGVKSEGYSRGLRWVFKDIAPKGPSGLEQSF